MSDAERAELHARRLYFRRNKFARYSLADVHNPRYGGYHRGNLNPIGVTVPVESKSKRPSDQAWASMHTS